jgi:acetylornithine deacetylase
MIIDGVLDRIDAEPILADLVTMVGFASVGGTAGETAVQLWCAEKLAGLGAQVDVWEIDVSGACTQADFPGMEVERDRAVGVVGSWGDADPALILCGHTDVVPPGDLTAWSTDPFTMVVRDGHAVGRGTCDMLGGLAAVLTAVRAVRDSGAELRRGLAVHTVSAEEDGGLGAWATLRHGHRGAACVIAEPTSGELVVANGGSLTFRLEVPGLATHGSARLRGVSAIDKLVPLLAALAELEAVRNAEDDPLMRHLELPYPISVGKAHAGDWASTVPDLAVLEGRYGVRLGEDIAAAQQQFADTVGSVCAADPWLADHPVRISWPGGRFASGRLRADDPLADQVAAAATSAGARTPHAVGAPYGSDLRHFAAVGIPTLQYGPGDVGLAHAADERVPVAELVTCARTYAALILARCS